MCEVNLVNDNILRSKIRKLYKSNIPVIPVLDINSSDVPVNGKIQQVETDRASFDLGDGNYRIKIIRYE